MTRKQLNYNIRRYAHYVLKLDEDQYREIVDTVTNKRHITDCTQEEAELVFAALKNFSRAGRPPAHGGPNAPQHRFIARLMEYLDWSWKQTAAFCQRIVGRPDTRSCDAAELRKVIRGMIAMIEQNIASGRLKLTPYQLTEFRKHTQRETLPSSSSRRGAGDEVQQQPMEAPCQPG